LVNGEANREFDQARGKIDQLTQILHQASIQIRDQSEATAQRSQLVLILAVLVSVAIGSLTLWNMGFRIGRKLTSISRDLATNASQTALAATQIHTSSQAVADGASTQAASLEETSASLEES